jgi:hypothetical protein
MFGAIGRAIKRIGIAIGIWVEDQTNTDAINQAQVEHGIRESKEKADKAHYANGQLAGQISMLKDQVKRQARQKEEVESMLKAAISQNDEANGALYAEQLGSLEGDVRDNEAQLKSLEDLYKLNTETIANSIREIQKFQREFEQVKARVAISRNMEGLATMMKSSITELQGMTGGEMGNSMEQLRKAAANGEGQMRATMDLAKEMGADLHNRQEAKKARGSMLFQEYKNKLNASKGVEAVPSAATPAAPARQAIQV